MPEVARHTLDDLPSGEDVFIDANVFVYAACMKSAHCARFLRRCAAEELYGLTTFEVLNEVTHRLMLAEAMSAVLIARESASSLARRPEAIRTLSTYWRQVEGIMRLNLLIIPMDESRMRAANTLRAEYGLLTNDSLLVAAMEERGVVCLASADSDFDQVPHVARYAPSDISISR